MTEQDLANMQRISSGRLSAGESIHHQTQSLLSSLLANQSQYPTRYGSPATGQSPVYEKKSPPPFWSPTRPKNDNNNNQVENRNLNRNVYNSKSKRNDTIYLYIYTYNFTKFNFLKLFFRWIT